jgi:hypothetical protein
MQCMTVELSTVSIVVIYRSTVPHRRETDSFLKFDSIREEVEIVGQLTQWVTKFTYEIYFQRGMRKIPMTSLSTK